MHFGHKRTDVASWGGTTPAMTRRRRWLSGVKYAHVVGNEMVERNAVQCVLVSVLRSPVSAITMRMLLLRYYGVNRHLLRWLD